MYYLVAKLSSVKQTRERLNSIRLLIVFACVDSKKKAKIIQQVKINIELLSNAVIARICHLELAVAIMSPTE